jgi:hypothetical protein
MRYINAAPQRVVQQLVPVGEENALLTAVRRVLAQTPDMFNQGILAGSDVHISPPSAF